MRSIVGAPHAKEQLPMSIYRSCSNCLAPVVTRTGSAQVTLTSPALSGVTLSSGFVSRTTVTASGGELNVSVEITPVDSDDELIGIKWGWWWDLR